MHQDIITEEILELIRVHELTQGGADQIPSGRVETIVDDCLESGASPKQLEDATRMATRILGENGYSLLEGGHYQKPPAE